MELAAKPRQRWSATDAREIHRVAARIGLVGETQEPSRTLQIVADLEISHHRDPDARLRLLREIAENACLEDVPACIRCPLQASCHHHRVLQEERQKTRSPIRRLWR
jgi:adenine-specific DNA glycosylase